MNTTVDTQEIEKFEQYATQWWDKNGPLRTLHAINPARLAFVQSHTTLKAIHLLDVGCGGGIFTEALAVAGANCTGIDAEARAIETAKAHAKENKLAIHYQCQQIEHMPQAAFDVVTCMEMLEHVREPALVIAHSTRLLKPGGLLFLSTINRTMKAYLGAIVAAEYILNLLPRQTHDYDKFITPAELAAMSRQEGLELLDLKGLHYNPLNHQAALVADVSINYLAVLRKKAG